MLCRVRLQVGFAVAPSKESSVLIRRCTCRLDAVLDGDEVALLGGGKRKLR
jgi:hypothetical protein